MQKILKTVGPRVNDIYLSWERRYLADCRATMPFMNVSGNGRFLEDQIEFIRMYLGFMLIDGPGWKQTVERVERFLSLQGPVPGKNTVEIHFVGGAPIEVIVCVEDLGDVDVGEVHSLVGFDAMYIYKSGRRRWTRKSADAFIMGLRGGLGSGWPGVDLKHSFNGNQLIIECGIG